MWLIVPQLLMEEFVHHAAEKCDQCGVSFLFSDKERSAITSVLQLQPFPSTRAAPFSRSNPTILLCPFPPAMESAVLLNASFAGYTKRRSTARPFSLGADRLFQHDRSSMPNPTLSVSNQQFSCRSTISISIFGRPYWVGRSVFKFTP